jgi:hypothetical protein
MNEQIIEADHSTGLLDILTLTQSGTWEPICTVAINSNEIIDRYRTPLLLRLGYSHATQLDVPQRPGEYSRVIPHRNRPEQSSLVNDLANDVSSSAEKNSE